MEFRYIILQVNASSEIAAGTSGRKGGHEKSKGTFETAIRRLNKQATSKKKINVCSERYCVTEGQSD
jgi:hypothetical protein